MSRAERLLDLLQVLRCHRYRVSGAALAAELEISLRTLYRDVAALQAQGAPIEGEPGIGYVLKPGFMLPPLMFSEEELEAMVLGIRWVTEHGDARLAEAARHALAKIAAVLPPDLRQTLDAAPLLVGPSGGVERKSMAGDEHMSVIRQAIRSERILDITYLDSGARQTQRSIWPFAIGYFDRTRVVAAWCEMRRGYRHFRTDRISGLSLSAQRYPRRRATMLDEWRSLEKIARQ